MPRSPRLALAALSIPLALAAAAPTPAPAPESTTPNAGLPFYLQGVDLTIPTQDAFRGWPPKELVERPFWLPWSWISLQRAALFHRPVLLLMTVDWNRFAQRLEVETLSDPQVLRALNDGFVAVRVDAERRPDLKERYQSGSWPVVALLLPDGMPMLSHQNPTGKAMPISAGYMDVKTMLFLLQEGRTYFERWSDLLEGVGKHWAKVVGEEPPTAGRPDEAASDQLARWLLGNADHAGGGFGLAPKFVVPGLAEYARTREGRAEPALAEHARATLEKLVASPLFDRREGGLHRMATLPDWKGIQYEKMLEGNAALVRELTFALRAGDSPALRTALADTCRFLTGVLGRPGGGFYLAQQADPGSADGGGYWTAAEPDSAKRPPLSRLVLAGENASAGAALLRAGALLDDDALTRAGKAALDLVMEKAVRPGRGAEHVIEPAPENRRFLGAQADVGFALVDAYESTGEPGYLRAARDIADFALNNLRAQDSKALLDHLPDRTPLGILDQPRHPLPDNARMARLLVRLAAHGAGDAYREQAASILGVWAGDLASWGVHGVEPALAVEELARAPVVIEIAGSPELRRAALRVPRAWLVITSAASDDKAGPGALVRLGERRVRVERADKLAEAVERVAGGGN